MRHARDEDEMASAGPWQDWQGDALIVGLGGIGSALKAELASRAPGLRLITAGRQQADLHVDLEQEGSMEAFGSQARQQLRSLRVVLVCTGWLHGDGLMPEKRLSQVSRQGLERSLAINGFGPLLLARELEALLPRQEPSHFASLSARVGSIGDNQLGGWYAYRAAKAAQNQLLKTLAIEWSRRLPLACVTLLHPGTTATALSGPFQAGVPPERLFSTQRAARQLLDVLESQGPRQSGQFLAWDGQTIPW
ncbi:MAG: SDR family oxidoreductase [Synechococcaceae cyanobacterium]|jgi:NAD(P)-dependent dehydrogenase (short-subunit alcohol dehydrogenase family)